MGGWPRRSTLPSWAALLLVALAPGPAAAERIERFDVELHVEEDGAFTVVEEIRYDFGAEQRRGIYRDIPVRYTRSWQEDYDVRLRVLEVTDAEGRPRPRQIRSEGASLRIRVGDPDVLVTGGHDYRFVYHVKRATVFREAYDEVYWNVTGNAWPVAIERAEARVHLPAGVDPGALQTVCFTGAHGSKKARCTISREAGSVHVTALGLGPGEGLTVGVGLPKGVLREPSRAARAFDTFRAWGGFWLLAPLGALGAMRQIWRARGRDRGARDALPVRYEPPEGLTPAEVGTLVDESADMEDVTATLLDLAVRGYLRIEEIESKKFLFLSERDWWLHKLRDGVGELDAHELALHRALFRESDTAKVSSLKNRFYTEIPAIKEKLYERLCGREACFSASPDSVRSRWRAVAVGVAGLGAAAWMFLGLPPLAGLAAVACGVVVIAFAPHMPRRTRKGRRVYEEILGFQEFMARVDADRLERLGGRTAENFERCLPYAIVLGVADPWADAFADLYTAPPDWYRTPGGGGFHPRHFVADVGTSLRTMEQAFASQPSGSGGSTGWSAGGAFSGGGGFSGGGFGGGGGGSW